MHSTLQQAGDNAIVALRVSHSNLKHHNSQLRFSLHASLEKVKERLSVNTGTAVGAMLLQLFDDADKKICDMRDDSRPLGFYSPMDGFRIHIVDLDPASVTSNGWLEDTSLVEKYTITEDSYKKRDGTFRKFKEKRLAEHSSCIQPKVDDHYMEDLAMAVKVGDRCEIDPGAKRGVVMFVGKVETLGPGYWVGVKYDEPVGKHDGIVRGKRYFSCPEGHGAVLRPDRVKVGDYPELDPFDDVDEI